mgnify:CR=1 FL=1
MTYPWDLGLSGQAGNGRTNPGNEVSPQAR